MKSFTRISFCIVILLSISGIVFAEVNRLDGPHDQTNAIGCGQCHVPVASIPMPVPRNWLTTAVCQSCHTDGGIATAVRTHTVADTMWCQNCHNPHQHQATYNRYYIKESVVLPNGLRKPMAFLDSTDFIHGTNDEGYTAYDGICETCHTQTAIYRNNVSGSHPAQPSHQGSAKCTTCHDHAEGFEPSCTQCHNNVPGWTQSAHGNPQNPSTQAKMLSNSCTSCHGAHNADDTNLRFRTTQEEQVCLSCHDGAAAPSEYWAVNGATNVAVEFQKTYKHPVTQATGVHNRDEVLPETSSTAPRHVECADCHNPHQLRQNSGEYTGINPALRGVSGITRYGQPIAEATKEYEICLKCHGASANLPANQISKITEFDTLNGGYHPVFGVGKNTMPTTPQVVLLAPWTSTSVMKCTDCHTTNNVTGPKGPHGSTNPYLLKKAYYMGYGTTESANLYALCYECHRRNSYINESQGSRFNYHKKHVQEKRASCYLCHASHGASTPHMIRFPTSDPLIIPSTSGRLEYIRTSQGHGQCYVRCHGKNHNPLSY